MAHHFAILTILCCWVANLAESVTTVATHEADAAGFLALASQGLLCVDEELGLAAFPLGWVVGLALAPRAAFAATRGWDILALHGMKYQHGVHDVRCRVHALAWKSDTESLQRFNTGFRSRDGGSA